MVMHLIFNMLWLWFGTLLLTVFSGTPRLMAVISHRRDSPEQPTYLLFGLAASLTVSHSMVGASAAVLAVVAATAVASRAYAST